MEIPKSVFPFKITEHVIQCTHIREYPRATCTTQDEPLKLAIKQYTPLNNLNPKNGDITIIAAHGSGLPKELYEPMFEDLLRESSLHNFRIRNIWIADASHQGESGILNEERLGNDPSWFDHSRDLFQMANTFASEMPRPIFGLGHSMGAAQILHLSIIHPRLFTSMVILEPVAGRCINSCSGPTLTKFSTFRQDHWDTYDDAYESAKRSYKSWDPRVLDRWCDYGLRFCPTLLYPDQVAAMKGAMTLTTTKHQEVMSYLRPNFQGNVLAKGASGGKGGLGIDRLNFPDLIGPEEAIYPFYRSEPVLIDKMLDCIRPSVLYIFGNKSPVSSKQSREDKLNRTGTGTGGSGGRKEGRVAEFLIEGKGHLIPMDSPDVCARTAVSWIVTEVAKWRCDEARVMEGWDGKSHREKTMVSQEWIMHIGGNQAKL